MQNEIVKIEQMPMAEITAISKTFFDSGLFTDAKNQAHAMVKILAGQEIGIPPFAAMSGIHIIQGKPTIGAGLIASRIKGSGKYDYTVKQMDDKVCSIDFFQAGKPIGNSTFTEADAKKAQTKNLDKFPKNMLFARAISNGVKWFCPDVFAGPVYTPEEMIDITHEEVKSIADLAKPLPALKEKPFAEALVRIEKGEVDVIEKLKTQFALTADQLARLQPFEAVSITQQA